MPGKRLTSGVRKRSHWLVRGVVVIINKLVNIKILFGEVVLCSNQKQLAISGREKRDKREKIQYCINWHIDQIYSYHDGGYTKVRPLLNFSTSSCTRINGSELLMYCVKSLLWIATHDIHSDQRNRLTTLFSSSMVIANEADVYNVTEERKLPWSSEEFDHLPQYNQI